MINSRKYCVRKVAKNQITFVSFDRERGKNGLQNVSCIFSFWLGIYHPWASHTISAQVTHSYISGELKRNNEDGCRERPRKKNVQKFFPIILEFLCFFKDIIIGELWRIIPPFFGGNVLERAVEF